MPLIVSLNVSDGFCDDLRLLSDAAQVDFACAITLRMKADVYAPKDRIPPPRLYLITEGSVKRDDELLGPGAYWGADDVVREEPSPRTALATTYLHVQSITRADFRALRPDHPEAYAAMQVRASTSHAWPRCWAP